MHDKVLDHSFSRHFWLTGPALVDWICRFILLPVAAPWLLLLAQLLNVQGCRAMALLCLAAWQLCRCARMVVILRV